MKPKRHYAWTILIACCLIQLGGLGLAGYATGLFYVPVTAELGIGRGSFALAQTIQGLVNAVSLLLSGKILRKSRHLNRIVAAGMAGVSICFALQSTFTAIWQWYITAALIGFCSAFVIILLVPTLINNWFETKVGLAFGFASMCSGLGGALLTNIGTYVMASYGWRTTYVVLSAVAALLVIPAALLLVRKSPADMGLRAYGAEKRALRTDAESEKTISIDYKTALKSKTFYLLLLGGACILLAAGANNHYIAFADSLGLPSQTGAAIASVLMVSTAAAKLVLGSLNDRFGTFKTFCGVLTLLAADYLAIAYLNSFLPVLFVTVAIASFNIASGALMPSLLVKQIFGSGDFGRILAAVSMGTSLVGAFASSIIGYAYDLTGSYSAAFVFCSACCALSVVFTSTAVASGKKLKSRQQLTDAITHAA